MNKLKTLVAVLAAYTFFGCAAARYGRAHIAIHLSEIVDAQDRKLQKLGIKHFDIPSVTYTRPKNCKVGYDGCYDQINDRIFLAGGNPKEMTEWLYHELGHFYVDKLSESLDRISWPMTSDKLLDENIGTKLVSEGIGEYFKRAMTGEGDKFKNYRWPKKSGKVKKFWDPRTGLIYDGGYHLVKPIIDKCGKEGLIYVMSNPPAVPDLIVLPAYQKRALAACQNNKEMRLPRRETWVSSPVRTW